MSAENRLPDYLEHMRQAAIKACHFVEGQSRESFFADERNQDAVIKNFIVIGEAVTRIMKLYPEFMHRHPEIRWLEMRSMRNRFTHTYFDIDYDVLWDTVQTDLPELLKQLSAIEIK